MKLITGSIVVFLSVFIVSSVQARDDSELAILDGVSKGQYMYIDRLQLQAVRGNYFDKKSQAAGICKFGPRDADIVRCYGYWKSGNKWVVSLLKRTQDRRLYKVYLQY